MKSVARSLVVVLVALIAVPALVVTATITTAVQLLATTVLILGGTGHSLGPTDDPTYVKPYLNHAVNNYIDPGGSNTIPTSTNYNVYAVTYPAEFFPVSGSKTFDDSVAEGVDNLGSCLGTNAGRCNVNPAYSSGDSPAPSAGRPPFIVFGYSQSAVVASLVKNQLIDNPSPNPALNGTQFYLISNPMRPNGGILGRGFEGMTIPILGITFYGPTENSCGGATCAAGDPTVYPTVDVAQQYDFLGGDAPSRPLNVLAMANSLAAYAQLHGDVPTHSIGEPGMINQGTYGDTQYYMISSDRLPILLPLQSLGVPSAALALPDAILRVWIEDAYSRDKSPGEHVQFQIIPIGNPVSLIGNTLGAIPVGIDDTVQQATGTDSRPLGTADVYRPFGVGGPVYNKETGAQTTDSVGIPTGSGSYGTTSVKPQPQQVQPTVAASANNTDTNNVATTEATNTTVTPEVTRPRPLQIVRDSLNFGPTKKPSATSPSGDGPLKKIVGALTGQSKTDNSSAADSKPAA